MKLLDWLQPYCVQDRCLELDPSQAAPSLLLAFSNFFQGKEVRSVVIYSESISAPTKLIAFHALETGLRVVIVLQDPLDLVTLDVLRLTHAGIVMRSMRKPNSIFFRLNSSKTSENSLSNRNEPPDGLCSPSLAAQVLALRVTILPSAKLRLAVALASQRRRTRANAGGI
jgi:hypothetical protein